MYTILLFVVAGLLVVIYLEYFHQDYRDRLDSRGRSGGQRRRRNTNRG